MATNVMLAHPYDPDKHASKVAGWWISIKYDGVRGKWNGEEMETRAGNVYTLPDFLTEQLESIVDEDGEPMLLDGELWAGNDTFALMSGMARRFENNDELWKNVCFMVFDLHDTSIPLFEDRVTKIGAALKRAGNPPNVKSVKYYKYKPEQGMTIEDELKKVEDTGGEGLVLRKPKSPYEFKRSQNMLKVKSWTYREAIVTGYEAGKEGKTARLLGMVGSLLVKSDQFAEEDPDEEEGSEPKWVNFKVGSGLNDSQRFTGSMKPELAKVKKWGVDLQKKLDILRKNSRKEVDYDSATFKGLIDTINTTTGKERSDALHELNDAFQEIPIIGSIVTFRFKELTKDGNPSMSTFVTVRSDLDFDWAKRHE